jgi:tetratricopeptide (TPR) repeat protein
MCGGTLLVSAIASIATAQGSVPPLPQLALDRFPESARVPVTRAYEAAKSRPADAESVGALARVLHAWEQWASAHEAYARAQALAPGAFEWHYLDAMALQRIARHAEAAERLKSALAAAPDFKPARIKLPDALYESGRIEESRRLFEELLRDPVMEPFGRYGLGRIAVAEKRHEAAVEHLQRAVALFPEWGSAHYALALSYRALGRTDAARHALQRHAQYGAQWPALEDPVLAKLSTIREDGRARLERGISLAARGDLPNAIAAHEAALEADPSLTRAHANLISLYGRAGEWQKAEEHYRAVARLDAEAQDAHYDAHYDYGVLLGLQQKWDEAAAAYRKAIAANPQHTLAHNNLAEVLERQGKIEAALDQYRKAVETQPRFRLARFNVARMLLALGRVGDAVAELEKIVEPRDAESPRYLFGLAVAHVRAGRKEEGIKLATEARQLALEHGQTDLAASIERDLSRVK